MADFDARYAANEDFLEFRAEVRSFLKEGAEMFSRFRNLLEEQSGERERFTALSSRVDSAHHKLRDADKRIDDVRNELNELRVVWKAQWSRWVGIFLGAQGAVLAIVFLLTNGRKLLGIG